MHLARAPRSSRWTALGVALLVASLPACWEASKAKETPASAAGAAGAAGAKTGAGNAGAPAGASGTTSAGAAGKASAGAGGTTAGAAGSATAGKAGNAGGAGGAGAGGSGGGPACDDVDVACPKGSFCGYAPCDAPQSFNCPRVCNKLVPKCTATACADTEHCTDITYNDVDMGYCEARALPDAPCEYGVERSCVDGHYCSEKNKVHRCAKVAALGADCEIAAGSCGPGNYCAGTKGCAPSLAAGATCADTRECQTGLFCTEAKVCEAYHPVGGTCRSSGYSCTNGKCYATALECEKGLACAPSGPTGECFSAYQCGISAGISCCVGANNEGKCGGSAFCPGPMGVCAAK